MLVALYNGMDGVTFQRSREDTQETRGCIVRSPCEVEKVCPNDTFVRNGLALLVVKIHWVSLSWYSIIMVPIVNLLGLKWPAIELETI